VPDAVIGPPSLVVPRRKKSFVTHLIYAGLPTKWDNLKRHLRRLTAAIHHRFEADAAVAPYRQSGPVSNRGSVRRCHEGPLSADAYEAGQGDAALICIEAVGRFAPKYRLHEQNTEAGQTLLISTRNFDAHGLAHRRRRPIGL
jgi:hypothetical protein